MWVLFLRGSLPETIVKCMEKVTEYRLCLGQVQVPPDSPPLEGGELGEPEPFRFSVAGKKKIYMEKKLSKKYRLAEYQLRIIAKVIMAKIVTIKSGQQQKNIKWKRKQKLNAQKL